MHKGNIVEDLRLQYRGREPRFSCQFQSSSTGFGVGPASHQGSHPSSHASLFDHVLQHSCVIHTNSLNSKFYSISGAYPVFIVDKGGLEYKKS